MFEEFRGIHIHYGDIAILWQNRRNYSFASSILIILGKVVDLP